MSCPATAIFSLTERGNVVAQRLLVHLSEATHHHQSKPFIKTAQTAFNNGERCIFICATGIVIRTLAPVLRNKYQDPAVLVLDEHGQYIIPLLSGHEGGAGQLAFKLAKAIGAQCVVTSATDYGQPAVYTIGMGSDRGCPYDMLEALLKQVKKELGPDTVISSLASIDLKADEPGLVKLADQMGLSLQTYNAKHLRTVESQLNSHSEIVFKEVGCYGVAEAAALCAATTITGQPAELVIPKQKNARATIAVARSYVVHS